MTIYLSFPTDVPCVDRYCSLTGEYGTHTHTFYSVYGVPARLHAEGMDEITASEIATVIRPNEIAPVNSTKGALQNV